MRGSSIRERTRVEQVLLLLKDDIATPILEERMESEGRVKGGKIKIVVMKYQWILNI